MNDEVDAGTLTIRTVMEPAPLCTVEYKGPDPADVPVVSTLAVAVAGESVCTVAIRGRVVTASGEMLLR